MHLETLQTKVTDQQFREKTRTLTESVLAMLVDQYMTAVSDEMR